METSDFSATNDSSNITDTQLLFSNGLNVSTLLATVLSLSPEDRATLFSTLGIHSNKELEQLVGGARDRAQSCQEEKLNYAEYRAHKALRLYVPPLLLLVGTFGNVCSFLVLRHKIMGRRSTHQFLAALAVTDSLVLYVGLLRKWVDELSGWDMLTSSQWLCKTIIMIGYTCSDVSVWIIVAVTVERCIVVCLPLKAVSVCSVSRAKRGVLTIVVVFLFINLHFLWTAGLAPGGPAEDSSRCSHEEGHAFLISGVWPWVDACLYGTGPFLVILTLNTVIIARMVSAKRGRVVLQHCRPSCASPRRRSTGSNSSSNYELCSFSRSSSLSSRKNYRSTSGWGGGGGHHHGDEATSGNTLQVPGAEPWRPRGDNRINSSPHHQPTTTTAMGSGNVRTTLMLLVVSFTFLLTTLPMNVMVILAASWNQRSSADVAGMTRLQLAFTVAELLMYANHTVNFFLYCAMGQRFRVEMQRLLCSRRRSALQREQADHSQHLYCSASAHVVTELGNSDCVRL